LKVLREYEHFSHIGKQISLLYLWPQIYNHVASKFNKWQSPPLAIIYYITVYTVSDPRAALTTLCLLLGHMYLN